MGKRRNDASGFVFYRSFLEAIDSIPDDQQLEAYQAIARYALDNVLPDLDSMSALPRAIFTMAKPQIDANTKRREDGAKAKKDKESKQGGDNPHAFNDDKSITELEYLERSRREFMGNL